MPVGIGERLSDVAARGRRANPRSPNRPKWLGPNAGYRRGLQRQIVDARGRPGETSGLATKGGAWLCRGDSNGLLRAETKKMQAQIFFADESGVRSDYHAGTTLAPRGATPVVEATGARFGLNMLSAVSARGEFRFMLHEGAVNAQVFREFLRRLMIGQSTPVFLIVDGHPAHRARLVREFVEEQGGRLKLWFLPPYSPELNPDELVWGHVKQAVAKKAPQTKAQLKQRILGALRRLQKPPDLLASFFNHPTCQYAR